MRELLVVEIFELGEVVFVVHELLLELFALVLDGRGGLEEARGERLQREDVVVVVAVSGARFFCRQLFVVVLRVRLVQAGLVLEQFCEGIVGRAGEEGASEVVVLGLLGGVVEVGFYYFWEGVVVVVGEVIVWSVGEYDAHTRSEEEVGSWTT